MMHRPYFIIVSILVLCLTIGCGPETTIDLKAINPDLSNGEEIYEDDCILCHEGAIEGAQRLDQTQRWEESTAKGFDQLVTNVVQGYQGKYGELPVMGMCRGCSQEDISDAVAYMLVTAGMME